MVGWISNFFKSLERISNTRERALTQNTETPLDIA